MQNAGSMLHQPFLITQALIACYLRCREDEAGVRGEANSWSG